MCRPHSGAGALVDVGAPARASSEELRCLEVERIVMSCVIDIDSPATLVPDIVYWRS